MIPLQELPCSGKATGMCQEQLAAGYLSSVDFVNAGEEIQNILLTLPKLKPFDTLDTVSGEASAFQRCLRKKMPSCCQTILSAEERRHRQTAVQGRSVFFRRNTTRCSSKKVKRCAQQFCEPSAFMMLSRRICARAFELLKRFVSRVDKADRFDERHLLPIATEVFGSSLFPLHTEYLALPKRRNSHILITARRMAFESYYSFVLTDFFEGLHHGHYPRQCEICGQYFLMQSARRQKYCSYGTAPELYNGKKISCRRYAIVQGKAERAKDNPSKLLTKNAAPPIPLRKEPWNDNSGICSGAQAMAKRRLEQAEEDDAYAKTNIMRIWSVPSCTLTRAKE